MASGKILNETAFVKLFEDYFKSLGAFAFGYLNDRESAFEIVQNCFAELWSNRHKLKNADNLKSYLYRMVRNDCINHIRKKRNIEGAPLLFSESFVEANLIKWETIRILYDAIGQLSPQSREIINYSLDGLKNQQIAELMNISVNTVQTVKQRAYQKMRVILKDHYYLFLLLFH